MRIVSEPGTPSDMSPLSSLKAGDVMRAGVLTCPPETPLSVVARMMSSYRVHCIVVTEPAAEADTSEQPWRVVSHIDLVRAAGRGLGERSAGAFASGDALTVAVDDTLEQVAATMVQNDAAHLVVRDSQDNPIGVVSTLDVIDALAVADRPRA